MTSSPKAPEGAGIEACPHHAPTKEDVAIFETTDGERWIIECQECFARGPELSDRAAVVAAWNRVAALRGERDAARAALRDCANALSVPVYLETGVSIPKAPFERAALEAARAVLFPLQRAEEARDGK